jgi:hypothetical protein
MSDRPTDAGISIFSTLEAFKDGLTSTLSRDAAADVCLGWAEKIDEADRPDLHGVRDGLVRLSRQLTDGDAEGPATAADIARTMKALGAHTAEAADTIDEAHLRDPLRRLGGYVKAAGIALEGGARPDEIAGVSTETGPTPGDPALRAASAAPDVSDEALPDGRAGAKDPSADLADDVLAQRGDETPGTQLNPS